MKKFFAVLLLMTTPAFAAVESTYDGGAPRATTPWYGSKSADAQKADLDFVAGMRPHHAGALTMSEQYLKEKGAGNATLQSLARGIIHNQTFEIKMLDSIEGFAKAGGQQIAAEGLVQQERFVRAPIPTLWGDQTAVTKTDVQFAKAMIVHHQAALDMANDYLKNNAAANGYLRAMCLDILLDQKQEINLMNKVIARYPGNPDDVTITPDMIHGMDHMNHAPAPKKKSKAAAHHHRH